MNKIKYISLPLLSLLMAILVLQGCGAAVVGGAAVGVSVIHDRRSAGTVLDDEKIEMQTRGRISEDKALAEHSSVGITSYNKVVLLTGQTNTEQAKTRIEDLTRKVPLVQRVVNEIQILPTAGLTDEGEDAYITSKVKLALFDLKIEDFDPTRVKVVTEQNVVYLMGLVTEEEATAVVEKVRYVNGVKRVVKIFEYIQPQS